MECKISVILPIYNVDKYLCKCLDSLVNQTYENLEIILVDDGSTDNCPKLCDEWKEKDRRIKVIHKTNNGPSSARNAGLDIATGEWISFIDPDDYVDKNLYSDLIGYFDDAELDLLSFGFNEVKNESITRIEIANGFMDTQEAIRHLLTWDEKVRSFVWDKIFRRSLIDRLRFSEELPYGEDTPFVFEALVNSKKYLQINTPYYYYVRRDDSLVGSCYKSRKLYTVEASRKILLQCIIRKLPYFDLARCSILLNCHILKKSFLDSKEIKDEFKEDYTYICDQMNGIPSYLVMRYLGFNKWLKYLVVKRFPLAYCVLSRITRKTR